MAARAPAPASAMAVHRIILRSDFIFRGALLDRVFAACGASYATAREASIGKVSPERGWQRFSVVRE
jgi:hypothetical protein